MTSLVGGEKFFLSFFLGLGGGRGEEGWERVLSCIGGMQQNYNLCGFNSRWVAPRWTRTSVPYPSLLCRFFLLFSSGLITHDVWGRPEFPTFFFTASLVYETQDGRTSRRRREKQVGGGMWGRCYQVCLPVATFILMPYHNGGPDCG